MPDARERGLLRRAVAPSPDGLISSVDPRSAGWEYLSFAAYRLRAGQRVERPADGDERLVLVLEGRASVSAGPLELGVLGTRTSVFDEVPPPVVLIEPGRDVSIAAASDCLVGIAGAPGGRIRRTVSIPPADIRVEARGSGQTARRVHHLLPPETPAGRLIAFEVVTPGGNWSSYPPHKHDTENPPVEARLEELYFYRFARPQGFALARVYTPDRRLDAVMAPMDTDLVLVPEGYHPVGVPAGYDCYYLNVMAGPERAWRFTVDPDHAWLMDWVPGAAGAPDAANPAADGLVRPPASGGTRD